MNELKITDDGVRAFLESRYVDGIGPAYARQLVEAFGQNAPDVILNDPQRAEDLPGIGTRRVETAAESLRKLQWKPEFLMFLYSCGLAETSIDKILGKYRKRAPEVVIDDPYSMVEEVWRLNFRTADKIGKALGIRSDDPRRLRGALLTAVKQYAEDGHLFATEEEAVELAARLTGASSETVSEALPALLDNGRLIRSRGGVYLPVFYNAEKEAARKLAGLARLPIESVGRDAIPDCDIEGHPYSDMQKEAIYKALNSQVMVLTGGPGTGKTTVLRGVIDVLEKLGKTIILAAPTGRAVKRMEHLTGREATTIHRLLGYREGQGYLHRPIDADVLVIDESSMMEQVLFDHLLKAVGPEVRVIMVGDVDQLPAIGAGDVLRQMIDSEIVPVARLTENFRQDSAGRIAGAARDINEGYVPEAHPGSDLMILEENSVSDIHDRILKLMTEEIPKMKGIRPTDIRVVTPQQIGPLGARKLNQDLQSAINPSGNELKRGLTTFREGDPVMQTANSRARGVYNGEVGHIAEVNPEQGTLTVEFSDGRRSVYSKSELGELVLAYATTVHKLQGSEVKYMILPVTMAHKPLLYRNLLYTGVSRASDLCVLVGEEEALRYAIGNNPASSRNSNFAQRLRSFSKGT